MAMNKPMIIIIQRARKYKQRARLIGVATNHKEAFNIFAAAAKQAKEDVDDATIVSGDCKGCRANYPRIMQSIKNNSETVVQTKLIVFDFWLLHTNEFIHKSITK